ncbi:MAG: DNA phosphorothioation system sulfurtransferase DndC, partial [Chroococcales cyanobacterium]
GTEYQYHTKSRRTGVYDALEKCFESSSRSQEEAIENAHYKRDLKTAAQEGDVYAIKQLKNRDMKAVGTAEDGGGIKQLSWGTMKYPSINSDDDGEN